jgi:hypothetical protein
MKLGAVILVSSAAVGEMRPHLARRELLAQPNRGAFTSSVGGRAWFSGSPVGTCSEAGRPLRAYGEVRANLAQGKFSAATPAARGIPRHPRAANEMSAGLRIASVPEWRHQV